MKTPSHTPGPRLDRSDYQTPHGLASFWTKDGLWHVAKRCPEIVDGLRTGGFRWTDLSFQTREEAACFVDSLRPVGTA